jgi:phosphate:Na+ symporter
LLPAYAALLRWWFPQQTGQADPGRPLYLDSAARETPVVALGDAAREALRMADVLQSMLAGLRDVLERDGRRRISELRSLDDILDRLNAALKTYVTTLDPEAMSDADRRRASAILTFATNVEQAGDVVDKGLLALMAKKMKRGLGFSKQGQAELIEMVDRLSANLKMATSLFMTEDVRAARLLAAEKENFRRKEADAAGAHFERLSQGRIETADTSSLHLDALRDLKLINAHLVAAAAYPVLEGEGELLPSRLRRVV